MLIHHLALRVKDINKSIAFYEQVAGLHVVERFDANPGECAYLQDGDGTTMIELIGIPGSAAMEVKGLFVCFGTAEIEQVHEVAVQGGYNPSAIRTPEPTAKYFYVYDPDGLSVQFREY